MPFSVLQPERLSVLHWSPLKATESATSSTTHPRPHATTSPPHFTPSKDARPRLELALGLVLISAIAAALIVSALCLFYMSRRRPRWRLLLFCAPLAIALGLLHASLNIFVQTQVLTSRTTLQLNSIPLAIIALSVIIPILGASLALLKIGALCSHIVSWKLRVPLYGPSLTFKVIRIVVAILCMVDVARRPHLRGALEVLPRGKASVALSCLQLGDDLCTLILMVVPRLKTEHRQRDVDSEMSLGTSVSSHSRRRALSLPQIAAGAFMFLLISDIAQLILTCRLSPVKLNYAGSYLFTVNVYYQIVCAILIVLWYHPSDLSLGKWYRRGEQLAVHEDRSTAMTARFLSPLPQHPGLRVLLADSGYGGDREFETEDTGESDTIGTDTQSTLHSKAGNIKVQTNIAPSAFRMRGEMEPSMVSYNGSYLVDEFGNPVFYAM